jgi:excisionase family DNA binding protein
MTVKDVARYLDVSEDTVRAFERAGRLPATKTSAGWRLFDATAVRRFAVERARQLERRSK